uniref:BTB domain-containing protein n=1 Tax=Panagrolaimus superbus TaxID=310955 RepID=A0A914YX85_9BILA
MLKSLTQVNISNPVIRKNLNNFMIENIGEDQKFVTFVLCFEFVYKKWNHYVADLNILIPFHTLPHLKFGDYFYEEFVFHQPSHKNGDINLKFKAYWVRVNDLKKAVYKLFVEKKDGILIKGADKDNMVLSIPDKPSSRTKYANKTLTFFFDFGVFPQLSPSDSPANDCFSCQSLPGMDHASKCAKNCYNYLSSNKKANELIKMRTGDYPNMSNYIPYYYPLSSHPYHNFLSSQIASNGSQKNEIPSKTYATKLDASIDENVPPEFDEIKSFRNFQSFSCLTKSDAPAKGKIFRGSSFLSFSGESNNGQICTDKNHQMLKSLPFNSEFGAPIGGRKNSFDILNEVPLIEGLSSEENLVNFSMTTSKTSTEAIPTSKPDNSNELDLTNPTLAKLFKFHDGKLTPISPPSTPQNVLKKLFPANSDFNKSKSDKSFEVSDPTYDFDCSYSSFDDSFKSTSSKPQNFQKPKQIVFLTSDGKEISYDAELLSSISPFIKSLVDKKQKLKNRILFKAPFPSEIVEKVVLFADGITFHETDGPDFDIEIYKFAKYLAIQSLMDYCVQYLKEIINDQTVDKIYDFAKNERIESLKLRCRAVIQKHNLDHF